MCVYVYIHVRALYVCVCVHHKYAYNSYMHVYANEYVCLQKI